MRKEFDRFKCNKCDHAGTPMVSTGHVIGHNSSPSKGRTGLRALFTFVLCFLGDSYLFIKCVNSPAPPFHRFIHSPLNSNPAFPTLIHSFIHTDLMVNLWHLLKHSLNSESLSAWVVHR